jgi:hypothetical protein
VGCTTGSERECEDHQVLVLVIRPIRQVQSVVSAQVATADHPAPLRYISKQQYGFTWLPGGVGFNIVVEILPPYRAGLHPGLPPVVSGLDVRLDMQHHTTLMHGNLECSEEHN